MLRRPQPRNKRVSSVLEATSRINGGDAAGRKHYSHYSRCHQLVREQLFFQTSSPRCFILLLVSASLFLSLLFYGIPHIEDAVSDPFLKAKIFNPLRYLQITYFESRPRRENLRTFVMSSDTAYVVNLDRDKQRMRNFHSKNKNSTAQRFSAHEYEWASSSTHGNTTTTSRQSLDNLLIQQEWEAKYPFLRESSKSGNYGDAGCSLSHLLLIKEKLLENSHQDYLFVFEDDAIISNPLLLTKTLQAPSEADMVLLTHSATKRVRIPWENGNTTTTTTTPKEAFAATRVIGGFGTLGYIISRKGAEKVFDYLSQSRDPIDITLFALSSLRVYLPVDHWPAVRHTHGPSTRLHRNG
jgi:GR25 family glycosyltransferase involved in LPS biosynthesis